MMIGAVLLTFVLQLAVIYLPFMQNIFGTKSLSLMELGISFGSSLVVLVAIDAVKLIRRKLHK
jgi:Ca2+-transporting ATPase